MGIIPTILTLHDLKSSTWESLPQNGPEWLWAIRSAKEGREISMGKSLNQFFLKNVVHL